MEFSAEAFREFERTAEEIRIEQEKKEIEAKLVCALQSGARGWCKLSKHTHPAVRTWLESKGFRLLEDSDMNILELHWD